MPYIPYNIYICILYMYIHNIYLPATCLPYLISIQGGSGIGGGVVVRTRLPLRAPAAAIAYARIYSASWRENGGAAATRRGALYFAGA